MQFKVILSYSTSQLGYILWLLKAQNLNSEFAFLHFLFLFAI